MKRTPLQSYATHKRPERTKEKTYAYHDAAQAYRQCLKKSAASLLCTKP